MNLKKASPPPLPHTPRRPAPARTALLVCLALTILLGNPPVTVTAAPWFSDPVDPPSPAQLLPPRAPQQLTPDPAVQAIIDQVQSNTLYDYVAGLSGEQALTIGGAAFTLATRSTNADLYIEKATQYAYERFQAMGLAVSYHTWPYGSETRRNVAAEQAGSDTDCVYLLTAHLDDTSTQPSTLAPGADDNASGTAGVLLAAQLLSQHSFTCTLRYVLFTGEEQGLLGSQVYANQAAVGGDPIQGVLNLDMIAYNSPGSAATIEIDIRSGTDGNPDRALSNMLEDVISAYQIDLTPQVYASDESGSDHYAFWISGYPAILAIEDWEDHTPHYHQTTDRVGTLNLPYFTEFVKAAVGTMAHLGLLASAPPSAFHKTSPANGAARTSMSARLSWTASSGATGYRYCVTTNLSSPCPGGWTSAGLNTSANANGLVSNTTYYWQVQAVNALATVEADAGQWWSFTPLFDKLFLPLVLRNQ